MNYLNYTRKNIPLGKEGWLANIFGGGNKNTDNWDQQTGQVTIGGKTYSTNNRNDVIALQDYLISKGHNLGVTKGNGNFGKNTQAALAASLSGQKDNTNTEHANTVAKENVKKLVTNVANPFTRTQGLIDGALYLADIAGLPTHMTNYLRDLNVSLPYRAKSAIRAGVDTMINDKSFQENYNNALENPRAFVRATSATPLTNSEKNYSDEELRILKEQAGNDYTISNQDIKRVSGNYGGDGSLSGMLFNPHKTVQLSIGRSQKGDVGNKIIYDTFDVNTQGETAEADNAKYREMAQQNKGLNYATLRATMPNFNMIDIVPKQYKINSAIQI